MNTMKAVSTNGLVKAFHGVEVIRHCSINVERGKIYGFLGANGAGKTTVFKMLTGLLLPTAGSAFILGLDMREHRNELQRKIGSIIETPIFYDHLSAVENLQIHLDYMGLPHQNIASTLERVGLQGAHRGPVSQYSLGMRQRLAVARAIVHEPELLILDEPINGLDPMGIRDMRNLFVELAREQGTAVLLSSHILSEIGQMADVVGVLANGTIVRELEMSKMEQTAPEGLEEYFLALMNGGTQNV